MNSVRPSTLALTLPGGDVGSENEEIVALFEAWHIPLLRYLRSLGLPAADREEVAQEVYLALARHLQRGRSRTNLRGWIFRVGHNLALKRRAKRPMVDENAANNVQDPAPDPEQQAAWTERQQHLRAVLAALPEQDRNCVFLRAEGLRYREIADVLGISLGSVANSLARSLERLARLEDR